MIQKHHKKATYSSKVSKEKQKNTKTKKEPKDDPKKISDFDYYFCRKASDFFWVEYAKRNAASKHSESYDFLKELYDTIIVEFDKYKNICKDFNLSCIKDVLDYFDGYRDLEDFGIVEDDFTLMCFREHTIYKKCFKCSPSLIDQITKFTYLFNNEFGNYFISIIDFFNNSVFENTLKAFIDFSVDKEKNNEKYKYKYNAIKDDGNEINVMHIFPNTVPLSRPKPQFVTTLPSGKSHGYGDLFLKVHTDSPNFSVEEAINQFALSVWRHLKLYDDGGRIRFKPVNHQTEQDIQNNLFFKKVLEPKRFHLVDGFLCNSIFQRLAGLLIWDIVNLEKKTMDEAIEFVENKIITLTKDTKFKAFEYSGYKAAYLKAKKYIRNFDPDSLKDL